MTCLRFVPIMSNKFEGKSNVATDNMQAAFEEKTFEEDLIKQYTKKQFILPSQIEDWGATRN